MMTVWRFFGYAIRLNSLLLILIWGACTQSEYTKLVKSELSRGIKVDSVLFGINLGDSRDEFYGKCFDLNKQHLITQGPKGATVQYLFSDSLVHENPTPMRLLFIPAFDDHDRIKELNLEFSYIAWSPWNKEYQSLALIQKVQDLLMVWYKGNPFIFVKINEQDLPVKLDGNRRLIVYIKDEQNVVVKVQDILNEAYKHSISK
ncbi:MAG: hypothetical protein KF775_04300 [Cyclobacteriaceae bacterium]|nr:hypothetical protein [Cyclobacteriaceae bacterium]